MKLELEEEMRIERERIELAKEAEKEIQREKESNYHSFSNRKSKEEHGRNRQSI